MINQCVGCLHQNHTTPCSAPPGCDCGNPSQCWEPCGHLGHDEAHVVVSRYDPELEKVLREIFA